MSMNSLALVLENQGKYGEGRGGSEVGSHFWAPQQTPPKSNTLLLINSKEPKRVPAHLPCMKRIRNGHPYFSAEWFRYKDADGVQPTSFFFSFLFTHALQLHSRDFLSLYTYRRPFSFPYSPRNTLTSVLGSPAALSRAFLHSIAGVSNNTAAYCLRATNRSSKCSILGLL
jgi:hypothetical protein